LAMDPEVRAALFERVDKATRAPMLVLSLVMVPLLLGPLLFDLSEDAEEAFLQADLLIWAGFALELIAKTYLAPRRFRYLRDNWLDVVMVAVPVFRPLRALRVLRMVVVAFVLARRFRSVLATHALSYSVVTAAAVVILSAFAMSAAERGEGGTIDGFWDALWWAITTVTTVGYGDKYPVSVEGKAIAVFLMIFGIALFGLVTASLAAFLVRETGDDEVKQQLKEIADRLERLEKRG